MPQDRLRKNTEENRELANNLKKDMEATRRSTAKPSSTSHKKRPFGSDLAGSSARGSEERSSVAPPRGTKRGREYEGVEKVMNPLYSSCNFLPHNRAQYTSQSYQTYAKSLGFSSTPYVTYMYLATTPFLFVSRGWFCPAFWVDDSILLHAC